MKTPDGKKKLEVGMGATVAIGSDSYAYTIIAVSDSGKTITIQEDSTKAGEGHDYYNHQVWVCTPNPKGKVEKARWSAKYSRYYLGSRFPVAVDVRSPHQDPCF